MISDTLQQIVTIMWPGLATIFTAFVYLKRDGDKREATEKVQEAKIDADKKVEGARSDANEKIKKAKEEADEKLREVEISMTEKHERCERENSTLRGMLASLEAKVLALQGYLGLIERRSKPRDEDSTDDIHV